MGIQRKSNTLLAIARKEIWDKETKRLGFEIYCIDNEGHVTVQQVKTAGGERLLRLYKDSVYLMVKSVFIGKMNVTI